MTTSLCTHSYGLKRTYFIILHGSWNSLMKHEPVDPTWHSRWLPLKLKMAATEEKWKVLFQNFPSDIKKNWRKSKLEPSEETWPLPVKFSSHFLQFLLLFFSFFLKRIKWNKARHVKERRHSTKVAFLLLSWQPGVQI